MAVKKEKKLTKAPKASEVKAEGSAVVSQQPDAIHRRREIQGTVISDKMMKTIVVQVDQHVRHPLYKKYVLNSRHFKAHDERRTAKVGDYVTLIETRPISKAKRWALKEIVRRGGAAGTIQTV